MKRLAQALILLTVVLLLCAQVLADRLCTKCKARAESDRWVYCPFCGTRYDTSPVGAEAPSDRANYESVSWEKIRLDCDKFHHKQVRFEARFNGVQHHFAPAERIGITEANYVNFYFIGNWTNYVKSSNARLVERLKRLSPYANIIIFGEIQVLKNPGGQDIILVLVDDIDV